MYELDQLRRWSGPNVTAIDVGANEGLYSYKFAQWFGRVEAFEPNPEMARRLRQYGARNVHVHEFALSSSARQADLHVPVTARGFELHGWGTIEAAAFDAREQRTVPVQVRTLDSFQFGHVAVIKIDVEGHEREVLTGAGDTIDRCRPVVLTEVKADARQFVSDFFQKRQYRFYCWDAGRFVELQDGLGSWTTTSENLFAIPDALSGATEGRGTFRRRESRASGARTARRTRAS
jgi:FkbM family methyltransferase